MPSEYAMPAMAGGAGRWWYARPVGFPSIMPAPHRTTRRLAGLPAADHGFHVHVNPNCGLGNGPNGQPAAGMAAGDHYDPANTGKHRGPLGEGHKGDLPVLTVDESGKATKDVVAPHLTVADVKGHSIMIHVGGDNYSDQPAPLGGGGARIACGVVE